MRILAAVIICLAILTSYTLGFLDPLCPTYAPGFWQLIKFAWVQYLAVLVMFWWVLSYVQSFVFENQVILTSRHNTNKSHKQ